MFGRKQRKQKKLTEKMTWREYAVWIFSLTALFLCFTQAVVINARVSSGSMEKTLLAGDRLLGNRLAYRGEEAPERYDVIIFRFPDDEKEIYIKRVIGLPGETVEIRDGKVYIDGAKEPLRDDFCDHVLADDFGPYSVPNESYFVLGDNRAVSRDSRYWENPFVEKEKIIAKAVLRYWPLQRICRLEPIQAAADL